MNIYSKQPEAVTIIQVYDTSKHCPVKSLLMKYYKMSKRRIISEATI